MAWGESLTRSFKDRLAKCRTEMQLLMQRDDQMSVKRDSEVRISYLSILQQHEYF